MQSYSSTKSRYAYSYFLEISYVYDLEFKGNIIPFSNPLIFFRSIDAVRSSAIIVQLANYAIRATDSREK